jgi:hypothetical protein
MDKPVDKSADAVLLWEKNIVPWLLSQSVDAYF